MAMSDESDLNAQLELSIGQSNSEESHAQRVERERNGLLEAVSAGKFDTLQERVAWVLNHYPETRDSDIALQLQYWDTFEPEIGGEGYIHRQDLYKLTRLTSLARARRKIQNTYKLFLASAPVRQLRGVLSEEEREKAAEQRPSFPLLLVYADESGKNGSHLIVGSLWILHPPEILGLLRKIETWRVKHKFEDEFHFHAISNSNLQHYLGFADLLAESASVVSFKAVSVDRAGIKNVDTALQELYYHLLVRGIEHEDETGRAPLPRGIQLWKDLEEPGRDKLFLASLEERLKQAASNRFGGQLSVDRFQGMDSKGQSLIQIADLYASSLNRVLNAEGKREGPKDRFADYLLNLLGSPRGPAREERHGDMAIHVSL